MKVEPYLFFSGRCEEALAFYSQALGAEITLLMRCKEAPEPMPVPPDWGDKVMHANLRIGDSTLMASDGCPDGAPFSGFALSLAPSTADQAAAWFNALSEGGKVDMPLQQTFWARSFGMLTDRFGMSWMINYE